MNCSGTYRYKNVRENRWEEYECGILMCRHRRLQGKRESVVSKTKECDHYEGY
jgi:hypothetical protein